VIYIVILGLNALLSFKAKSNTRICLFVMNHKPNRAITVIKSFCVVQLLEVQKILENLLITKSEHDESRRPAAVPE